MLKGTYIDLHSTDSATTSDGESCRSHMFSHPVFGHARVVAGVASVQVWYGQQGGVLVDSSHSHPCPTAPHSRFGADGDATQLPLDVYWKVPLGDSADDPQPLAPGQVLGKDELLDHGSHCEAVGGAENKKWCKEWDTPSQHNVKLKAFVGKYQVYLVTTF